MKYECQLCHEHLDYNERQRHAKEHNDQLVDPIPVSEMLPEVTFTCPTCFKKKATLKSKGLVCQCCSAVNKLYSQVK